MADKSRPDWAALLFHNGHMFDTAAAEGFQSRFVNAFATHDDGYRGGAADGSSGKDSAQTLFSRNGLLWGKGCLTGRTDCFRLGPNQGRLCDGRLSGKGAEIFPQLFQLFRSIPGRKHEDDEVPIRKFAEDVVSFQNIRDFLTGIARGRPEL